MHKDMIEIIGSPRFARGADHTCSGRGQRSTPLAKRNDAINGTEHIAVRFARGPLLTMEDLQAEFSASRASAYHWLQALRIARPTA